MTNSHSSRDSVLADLQWTPAGSETSGPVYDCWNTIGVSVRYSVGIEDADDLIADLKQAMEMIRD